jgi:hypothetical protein
MKKTIALTVVFYAEVDIDDDVDIDDELFIDINDVKHTTGITRYGPNEFPTPVGTIIEYETVNVEEVE